MFSIDDLPTDNLYKYLAVGGAVVIAFALSQGWRMDEQLRTSVAAMRVSLSEQSAQLQSVADDLVSARDSPSMDLAVVETRVNALKLALARSQAAMQNHRDLEESAEVLAWFVVVEICFGATLFVAGALLWYKRVQRHHDRLVERGASGAEAHAHTRPIDGPVESSRPANRRLQPTALRRMLKRRG